MLRKPLIIAFAFAAACGSAAEITLRDAARQPSGALLRLGDIADVRGFDAARLSGMPLMPKPAPGGSQLLSAQAVREMLAAQGEPLTSHRFEGAYFVKVATPKKRETAREGWRAPIATRPTSNPTAFRVRRGPAAATARPAAPQLVTPRLRSIAESAVAAAIQEELDGRFRGADREASRLAVRGVQLSQTAVREISQMTDQPLLVEFDEAAAIEAGLRSVRFWPESRGRDDAFRAVADLVVQPTRIVAATPIARGSLVVASMTRSELVPLDEIDRPRSLGYTEPSQAIGREATQAIRPGAVLSDANTAPPLMAQRGEEVEVSSGGGGISVTVRAVAQQDGRQGELVPIETVDGERFMARVVGPRRLAVLSAGRLPGARIATTGGLQ